ncbi:MAG: hypothetical protein F4137_24950 [Acidobacteria bacterium]|nr:hypothetical protein [Acidobacteriota bacterium]MYH32016.1 hypothetical protein [Acidobacteriota bacterium]
MKQIIPVALLAGAVPALLSGQTVIVNCPEERCQVAPYFAGEGGFVGESAGIDGEDEVRFIVVCGNTTLTSTAQPDSSGIVRQALNNANALNCRAGTSGRIEVDNLKPGGWYWINDDQNSAVSAFMPKSAIGNDKIEVTDPGGVVLSRNESGAATWVKHAPTGRVGIIPNIVPSRPIPGCSGLVGEATAVDCHLGSPEGWWLTASPSSVTRPLGGNPSEQVTVTLYGENFIRTGAVGGEADVEHAMSVEGILFNQKTGVVPPEGQRGVLTWEVDIVPDDNRCLPANNDPDRNNPQTVTFVLKRMDGAIPDPPDDSVETTFTVTCPADAASAAAATELVPENPFPVD